MTEIPRGVKLLIAALAASPLLQVVCVATRRSFLNFGGSSWWNFFIYYAIAPTVFALAYLQTPAVLLAYPRIDSAAVRRHLRGYVS